MNELERNLTEFDAKHEDEHGYVISADGVWVVYSDGARRSRSGYGPLGNCVVEPPADPKELRRWQKLFWEFRLEQMMKQFVELKTRTGTIADDAQRFSKQVGQLKVLQSKVRSARSKLGHLMTEERGYTQADVERCWDTWQRLTDTSREESLCRAKYENALLGKSTSGLLEKVKARFEEAKARARRAVDAWNDFTPAEARSIVSEQLDQQQRAERERELEQIEV